MAFAVAALSLVLALGLAAAARWTGGLDAGVRALLHGSGASARLRQHAADVTALGSGTVLIPLVLGTAALLLARGQRQAAAWLVAVTAGGRLAVDLLKSLFARERPALLDDHLWVHSASFPSAHAANAALVWLALALLAARAEPRRPVRALLFAGAAGVAFAVGLSRVWLGVHWPSDVAAGWLFGAGWVALWSPALPPRRLP